MTQTMPPDLLQDLLSALPPEIFIDFTRSIHPDDLQKLMDSLPPVIFVPLLSRLTPKQIRQLMQVWNWIELNWTHIYTDLRQVGQPDL